MDELIRIIYTFYLLLDVWFLQTSQRIVVLKANPKALKTLGEHGHLSRLKESSMEHYAVAIAD